jgi:hypothetical protein
MSSAIVATMTGKTTPRAATALHKYARLESPGLWREAQGAQRREVIVAFREATLVLSDPKSESALSHWSLPAVTRLNKGALPALYAADAEGGETLELDDPDMIAALETVRDALEAKRPRPGRLRGFVLGAGTSIILALGVFWLPDALIRHTASVLPAATRQAIGQFALADVQRLTGSPCTTPLGTYALTDLADRLFGQHQARILVMREGVSTSAHLPGGVILVGRALIEDQDGPEVLAGMAIMERLRAEMSDPILPVLRHAGLTATFRLLTTGVLPASSVEGYGEALLTTAAGPVPDDLALPRFRAAGVPTSPYARLIDPEGSATQGLRANDPMAGLVPQPLMNDSDWVGLQGICS